MCCRNEDLLKLIFLNCNIYKKWYNVGGRLDAYSAPCRYIICLWRWVQQQTCSEAEGMFTSKRWVGGRSFQWLSLQAFAQEMLSWHKCICSVATTQFNILVWKMFVRNYFCLLILGRGLCGNVPKMHWPGSEILITI